MCLSKHNSTDHLELCFSIETVVVNHICLHLISHSVSFVRILHMVRAATRCWICCIFIGSQVFMKQCIGSNNTLHNPKEWYKGMVNENIRKKYQKKIWTTIAKLEKKQRMQKILQYESSTHYEVIYKLREIFNLRVPVHGLWDGRLIRPNFFFR